MYIYYAELKIHVRVGLLGQHSQYCALVNIEPNHMSRVVAGETGWSRATRANLAPGSALNILYSPPACQWLHFGWWVDTLANGVSSMGQNTCNQKSRLKAPRHMEALVARVVGEYRVRRELPFQRRSKPMDTRGRESVFGGGCIIECTCRHLESELDQHSSFGALSTPVPPDLTLYYPWFD